MEERNLQRKASWHLFLFFSHIHKFTIIYDTVVIWYQLKIKALLKLNIINSSIKFYSVICLNGVILTMSKLGTQKKKKNKFL